MNPWKVYRPSGLTFMAGCVICVAASLYRWAPRPWNSITAGIATQQALVLAYAAGRRDVL